MWMISLRRVLCLTLVWMFALGFVGKVSGRTWTDRTGQFQVEAEFVSLDGTNVKLKLQNGKTISVGLEQLSAADQQHVRDLVKRMRATAADRGSNEPDDSRPFWPDPSAGSGEVNFEFAPFSAKDLEIPELADRFNKILDVASTSDGNLWFATEDGLGQWKDDERVAVKPFANTEAAVERLLVAPDGALWAVSSKEGVARRKADGSWEPFPLPDEIKADRMFSINQLHTLTMTPVGTIWLSTRLQGLLRFAEGKWERRLVEESQRDFLSFLNMQTDAEGTIWSVIGGRGLLRFDGERYEFVRQTPTSQPGPMALAPDGTLVIGFHPNTNLRTKMPEGGGLWVIQDGQPKLYDKDNSALPLNDVTAAAYAPDGALWVGLGRKGIARLAGDEAQHYLDEVNQPATNGVQRLTVTSDGSVWIFAKFMRRARPVTPPDSSAETQASQD